MAALTLTQFIAEVALACRNMPMSDPYYSSITTFVNRARNKIIRWRPDLFTELENSWTVGPTVAGNNVIAKPVDCIAVTKVFSARQATTPNWAIVKEWPLTFTNRLTFATLSKDTVTAGYPTIYTRKGYGIDVYPTPTAAYIDQLRVYGPKSETALAAGGDTFFSDEKWDDVTILWAAGLIQKRRGWAAQGETFTTDAKAEITDMADPAAMEGEGRSDAISGEGAPMRSLIYQ